MLSYQSEFSNSEINAIQSEFKRLKGTGLRIKWMIHRKHSQLANRSRQIVYYKNIFISS